MLSAMQGTQRILGGPSPVLRAIRHLEARLAEREESQRPRPVIIVDDLRPYVAHDLFGRARDEVWQLPLLWLASGDKARQAEYLKPPADSFFGKVVDLGPLTPGFANALLQSRAEGRLPEDVATRIIEQAKGNPRRVITLAAEALVDGGEKAEAVLERDSTVTRTLRELGPAAERLWNELVPMEQATAGDPQLLDRLGWSRVRASQVLNQLEKAGLVESSTDKTQPGRPRKVYRIRSQVATTA
jgi:hypothetical protein